MYSSRNTENRVPYTPAEQAIFDQMVAAVRVRHESYKTGQAYGSDVVRYYQFLQSRPDLKEGVSSEDRVNAYLTDLAPHCAAKTQNQHLCAIKRYYEQVLKKPLGDLGKWAYAKRPQSAPVWLNPSEVGALLGLLPGTWQLIGRVCYGSGLRLMELMRLRLQHIDLEKRTIFIMGGKGDKDRTVPLAASVVPDLAAHIQRVRLLWQGDQANGYPPVYLPNGLERKYPNAGRELAWFWLWPGRNLSRDPETGVIRRHHAQENGFQKAIKTAAQRAGIMKRVKVHTLRHSFATHFLEGGGDVHILQQLLGHANLETTAIYLHCLPKLVTQARSPLDDLVGAQVIAFPGVRNAAPVLTRKHA